MVWLVLLLAGALEVVWVVGLKYSEGFTRPVSSAISVFAMLASFWLLAMAVRVLPLGTSYAIWVGIGAVGAVIAGSILFGESLNPLKLVSMLLVLAGIMGLKLASESA